MTHQDSGPGPSERELLALCRAAGEQLLAIPLDAPLHEQLDCLNAVTERLAGAGVDDPAARPLLRALSAQYLASRRPWGQDPVAAWLARWADDPSMLAGPRPRALVLAVVLKQASRFDPPSVPERAAALKHALEALGGDLTRLELFWLNNALGFAYAASGALNPALGHVLAAHRLAQEIDLRLEHLLATLDLSFLLISAGDLESACPPLQRVIEHLEQPSVARASLLGNLLLAQVMQGVDAVDALARRYPEVSDAALWARVPTLRSALVLHRVQRHQAQEAERILGGECRLELAAGVSAGANRAWVVGRLRLLQGQPADAVAVVEAFRVQQQQQGLPVTPMNRTQLELCLSEAHEMLGDYSASLAALKRSQAAHHQWLSESLRSRLSVIYQDATPGQGADRRMAQFDAAAQRADTAAEPGPPRFLAHIMHELRNPLGGILGMTALLERSPLDPTQQKYLAMTRMSAQMMLSLCNDVLDLSKIEAGKFEVVREPHDLAAVAREVVEIFRPQLEAKGLVLVLDIAPHCPPQVLSDALRYRQILMNLVGNAAKFTRRGEVRVTIAWETGRRCWRTEVSDTGMGIRPEVLPRLFSEYQQADAAIQKHHGGTGLGLALCRQLSTLLGGSIGASSRFGEGSCFWFEVSAEPVDAPGVTIRTH